MNIEIEIEKMYGLNNRAPFVFKSGKKHNFIYGINTIGKSSVSKAIGLLAEESPYHRLIDTDSENFGLKFQFDDLIELCDTGNNIKLSNPILKNRVFVFNKYYLSKNIAYINSEEGGVQVGLRIAEREKYITSNNDYIEQNQKEIYDSFKKHNIASNKSDLLNESKISVLKATSKNKLQERTEKNNSILSIKEAIKKSLINISLESDDFNASNISKFKQFSFLLEGITKKLIDEIKSTAKNNKYVIEDITDKEFYEYIIRYLTKKSSISICPLCKDSSIDADKIIANIKLAIQNILSKEILSKIDNIYTSFRSDINSYFYKLYKNIYMSLIEGNYPADRIIEITKELNLFIDNYDSYILNFIGYKFDSGKFTQYQENNEKIELINKENEDITEDDKFITIFNQMLDYIFEKNEFSSKKMTYSDNGSNYYGIQLIINGVMKEGISIQKFWQDVLSESQKTKISLAFMFAFVLYRNYKGKILCVFDDPIDSYDSNSKYKMTRIIHEFIIKSGIFESYDYDCYDMIFSHSIDYFRLFYGICTPDDKADSCHYIMTNNDVQEIKYDQLFIVEGDYKILKDVIKNCNNLSIDISPYEVIALSPVLRELAAYSNNIIRKNGDKLKLGILTVSDLNSYISTEIIHGFSFNNNLLDILTQVEKYININIDKTGTNLPIFNYMKTYIDSNIANIDKLNFYDQIFMKNFIAIYIRSKYDYELATIIKRDISKYNGYTDQQLHDELRTIGEKIGALIKDPTIYNKNKKILDNIIKIQPMLNDFAHSANIFLTPLIDVASENLAEIYKNLK